MGRASKGEKRKSEAEKQPDNEPKKKRSEKSSVSNVNKNGEGKIISQKSRVAK